MAAYDVNYEDERFAKVESDKQEALNELDQTYSGMIGATDDYFQQQIDASKQWADKQSQLQQEQSDFAIEQIEQQKDQAHSDYVKEQSGAYADWQKQSDQYGTEAEKQASAGLAGSGFSESSQVSMYNAYQNRVAVARDSFTRAVLAYDNAMKDARLQNNAVLAEIAANALQQQLELSLQGFQYKNQLILEQATKKVEMDNAYYNRYLDVLNQINHENAMAEEVRQFNENYKLQTQQLELQKKQLDEEIRQFNQSYNLQLKQFNEEIRQFNEEIARLKKKDEQEYQLEIKNLELKKKQMEQEKKQWEAEMAIKKEQLELQKKQTQQATIKKSGGSSSKTSSGNRNVGGGTISKASGSGSSVQFDNKSVLDLGYGPISGSYLAQLEKEGKVSVTQKGNTLYASKTSPSTSAQKALDKYTIWKPK